MPPIFVLGAMLAEEVNGFIEQELTYVVLLVVAAVVAILTRYVQPFRRLPYTVALVVVGLLVSLLALPVAVPISSDLILAFLVPPLLFESTLQLKWERLRADLLPILLLALAGSLISTFIVAYVLEVSEIVTVPLAAAIAFGALISATDPVAVIAFFRTLGVSKRLTVLVEGESLFNDGVAIVIFSLAVSAGAAINAGTWTGFHLGQALLDALIVSGGGVLVGVVLGSFVSFVILKNVDDHLIETVTTLTLAFGSYLMAEEFGVMIGRPELHLSGILAVVAAGIFVGNVGRTNTSPTTGVAMDNFWELLAFIVNSFVFLIIGLTIDISLFRAKIGIILAAVAVVLISRVIVVYALTWLHGRLEPKRRIPIPYRHVMVWGGLRGAISLALALTLSVGPFAESAPELQLMTFGVVLFTLIVQGMSIETLIVRLGLGRQINRAAGAAAAAGTTLRGGSRADRAGPPAGSAPDLAHGLRCHLAHLTIASWKNQAGRFPGAPAGVSGAGAGDGGPGARRPAARRAGCDRQRRPARADRGRDSARTGTRN